MLLKPAYAWLMRVRVWASPYFRARFSDSCSLSARLRKEKTRAASAIWTASLLFQYSLW